MIIRHLVMIVPIFRKRAMPDIDTSAAAISELTIPENVKSQTAPSAAVFWLVKLYGL